jgi:putative transcriptional regulator
MLADRKMHSKELAEIIGTTPVNVSRIKTGQIRGIRLNTLNEICKALNCQPGDLFEFVADVEDESGDAAD